MSSTEKTIKHARERTESARALIDALEEVADFGEDAFGQLKEDVTTVFNALAPIALSTREASAIGWDAAVAAMRYEDGTPVELVSVVNPYRASE